MQMACSHVHSSLAHRHLELSCHCMQITSRQPRMSPRPRRWHTCQALPWNEAWSTHVNAQEIASNLFASSILVNIQALMTCLDYQSEVLTVAACPGQPYSAFLYFLTKSKKAPPLVEFGFYFLLVFVFGTIPAGVYALKVYGKSLANVDWLHGSAESLLTITNLFIVLGLRQGIRQAEAQAAARNAEELADDKQPSRATKV